MKKLLFIIPIILFTNLGYSQDQIVLKKNYITIECEILCITDSNYVFRMGEVNKSIAKTKVKNFILSDYYNRINKLCLKTYVIDTNAIAEYKYSQETEKSAPSNKKKTIILTEQNLVLQKDINYYSGLELQKYTKHHRLGTGFLVLGTGLSLLGLNIDKNGTVSDLRGFTLFLGVASSVVGTCFIFEAPRHIKNAGLILSGNGVGIKIVF